MNIEKYKSDYLDKRMQLILFYKESGQIVYSTETLFKALNYDSAYSINLFIESISSVLQELEFGNPLTFSCINSIINDGNAFYDYQFEVPSESESDLVVMQIFNFSDHYENLTHMQQERNELEIHKEIQKIEQEKVFAENELLAYKNSELERVQKLKTDFFARVSHEIRNPVNGISGLVQLIQQNDEGPEKIEEYLNALHSTADHLVNLVNNVLDFSKLESSDNTTIEHVECDLEAIINSVINSFMFYAKDKKISLSSRISDNVPKLLIGDKYKLTQVITNLIGNSIKFTHQGGIILTAVKSKEDETEKSNIKFEVRDTGIGIANNMIDKIFDPYTQADKSVKRLYGGTGLGLPIVRKLILLMGGNIKVSSVEGEGSVFSFNIPMEASSKQPVATEEDTLTQFDGRVLIGEDDLINQRVMEGTLKANKIQCDIGSNGEQVLDLFRKATYDLIILDINMPILDGFEVAHTVRKVSDIPIVVCSGKPYVLLEERLGDLENIEYLQKPVAHPQLMKILNRIIRPQEKIVDFNLFKTLFGNNTQRIKEIVSIFKEEAPINIQNMKQHLLNKDYEQLQALVHKAKSSFAYFGMKSTHLICDQIEKDLEKNTEKNYLKEIEKIEKDTLSALSELNQI